VEFFALWVTTRIREKGWPKSEGSLRRRKVIVEAAIVAAMQDAVRVAITIGGSLPDTARAIAITCMEPSQTIARKDVDEWIDKASAMGDEKMKALSETYPKWLRLCSITASRGDQIQHGVWSMADSKYDWDDPIVTESLKQATALAAIAMAWSLRHPSEAEGLFHDPHAVESMEPEVQELVSAQSIYSGWLHMAEELVSRYSTSVGFPRYEDLF
jgi:hypothetical protein